MDSVFYMLLSISMSILFYSNSSQEYTPEDIFRLIEASMQQYETISAEISAVSYKGHDENDELITQRTQTILSRWTKDRSMSQLTEHYVDKPTPNYPENTIVSRVITPEWNKEVTEASDGRTPRGAINSGFVSEGFVSPITAMWDISGSGIPLDMEHIDINKATLEKDKNTGYLLLSYPLGSHLKASRYTLYIDPDKDFIPVIKEWKTSDGILIQRYECELEKNPDNLWIPVKCSWTDPKMDYSKVYEYRNIEVNTGISSDMLDFAFPSGTLVKDNIANLIYYVDDSRYDENTFDLLENETVSVSDSDIEDNTETDKDDTGFYVRTLANEEELEKVVSQVENSGFSYHENQSDNSYFSYVLWILLAIIGCGFLFYSKRVFGK